MPRLTIAILLALVLSTTAQAKVWLSGRSRSPDSVTGTSFLELFAPGAQWNAAASRIQVLKFPTQYLQHAPEVELSALIRGLRERHIALGMEGLLLIESKRCGRGIEGYGGRGAIAAVAERIKRLGGTIDYVAMDEPLWYGTRSNGPRTCHDSITSIAQQLAHNVHILKDAFPTIEIGDIEPVNGQTQGFIEDILEFARQFHAATGEPLAFVHADLIWQAPTWRAQLAQWRTRLHAAGIRFGIICDGDPRDTSDEAWGTKAIARYRIVTSDPAVKPDDVIFQSWMRHPIRLIPDNQPWTLTNVVVQALQIGGR